MDAEIQIALSFVISYLYNKLPRRRVNLFGEELEKAIRMKFRGHWYPEKPFKGSAYRCLRVGDPLDSVIHIAACESGLDVQDIVENLPTELSVWIDPGEVSYRIGEKGVVKILYSKQNCCSNNSSSTIAHQEEKRSSPTTISVGGGGSTVSSGGASEAHDHCFNPDAQCFKPIESISSSMQGLNLGSEGSSPGSITPPNSTPSPVQSAFKPKSQTSLTFTTAAFAQTKFGSTKLKTSGKRPGTHRMSPTEFNNYIKQRAMAQQHQQQQHHHHNPHRMFGATSPHNARSLSPNPPIQQHQNFDPYLLMANQQMAISQNHLASRSQQPRRQYFEKDFVVDLFSNNSYNGTTTNSSTMNLNNQTIQSGGSPSHVHHQQHTALARPNFLDVVSSVPSLQSSTDNSPSAQINNNTLGSIDINDKGTSNATAATTLLDSFNFGNVYPNQHHLLVAN